MTGAAAGKVWLRNQQSGVSGAGWGPWRVSGDSGVLVGQGQSNGTGYIYAYPPVGASVSTHKIIVMAHEFNQCSWEKQHESNWSFEMWSDAPVLLQGSMYCPGWSTATYISIATPK